MNQDNTDAGGMPRCPHCGCSQFDIEYSKTEHGRIAELWTCRDCGNQSGTADADDETMTEYDTIEEARSAERPWVDESFLRKLYVEKRLSSIEIAQYIGNITDAGVRYWLEKHGIERRSRAEAATAKWAKLRDPDHLRRLADEIEAAIEDG